MVVWHLNQMFSHWVLSNSVTPWTEACQALLSCSVSQSLLKFMYNESVMSSNHLIHCCPFSSCPQSLPESGSFPMSWLFASGDQSIGGTASVSVLPVNSQGWFPLGSTGLISLQSKGLSGVFSNTTAWASVLQCSAFFMVQLSHPYMTTGKKVPLTIQTFCWQSDISAF